LQKRTTSSADARVGALSATAVATTAATAFPAMVVMMGSSSSFSSREREAEKTAAFLVARFCRLPSFLEVLVVTLLGNNKTPRAKAIVGGTRFCRRRRVDMWDID
jgi:hypothetical protein